MYEFPDYQNNPKGPKRNIWGIISMGLAGILVGCVLMLAVNPGGTFNWNPVASPSAAPNVTTPGPTLQPTSQTQPQPTKSVSDDELKSLLTSLSQQESLPENSSGDVIYERLSPSLVSIVTRSKTFDYRYGVVDAKKSEGSGVIITADGYLITNHHVIEGASAVSVILWTGEEVEAEIIGSDSGVDIALLKINRSGLTPARLGDSGSLKVGHLVYAMGNPLGSQFYASMTMGCIGGLERMIDEYDTPLVQTDAAINPGSSGGPLVNTSGEVIGICTMRLVSNTSVNTEGMSFFIPINSVKNVIENIMTGKQPNQGIDELDESARPRLGISVNIVRGVEELSQLGDSYPSGCLIVDVEANSPAEKAGLQMYDIIVEVDGERVLNFEQMSEGLNKHEVGQAFPVTVYRDKQLVEISVQLELLNL